MSEGAGVRFAALLLLLCAYAEGYNRRGCEAWPGAPAWATLAQQMSSEAALHGPITSSDYEACKTVGTDAYALSAAGNGICMHAHDCENRFCSPQETANLPAYVVEAKSEDDIAAALVFAAEHDIVVAVKATGHSYPGSSTAADSILVWMANYPKDGAITEDYVDSCGTSHSAVVGIGGGETWNDVLEAVKGQYHVVTGGARTVGAAGGWLQGGGLAFSSREYGLGVDQAVDFRVVLANGTVVTADACTNPDLFWALRGGGGGTFGVVTHVSYKLHPVSQIVQVNWFLGGIEWAAANGRLEDVSSFVTLWLRYWIEVCPTLDSRWSGFFNPTGGFLVFAGSEQDAKTTFVDAFDAWYDTALNKSQWVVGVYGALPPSATIEVFPSWHAHKGGSDVAGVPAATDPTGDAYTGVSYGINARLWPQDVIEDRPDEVLAVLLELALGSKIGPVNYFLGGKIQDVAPDATAMHPAVRKAIWMVTTNDEESANKVREFIPNDVTGVCYNHHSVVEPDWRNACWGTNYARLEELKARYDPDHIFNAWHLVGYVGEESPPVAGASDPSCPAVSHDAEVTVTLAGVTKAEFETPSMTQGFKDSVAEVIDDVEAADVEIVSVAETSTRRRLLDTSTEVVFRVKDVASAEVAEQMEATLRGKQSELVTALQGNGFTSLTNITVPCSASCGADAKVCPDGSGVGRDACNNCEFRECPSGSGGAVLSTSRAFAAGLAVAASLGCMAM